MLEHHLKNHCEEMAQESNYLKNVL